MTLSALATPADVVDIRPSAAEMDQRRLTRLIAKASAKLRGKTPFDIDARIARFAELAAGGVDNPVTVDPTALDPQRVADRVATIVKRFLVNEDGVASSSEGMGSFNQSRTFVNRFDKTGTDVRGEMIVTDEDIDDLRPAVPFDAPGCARVNIPVPSVYVPAGDTYEGVRAGLLPVVVPDVLSYDGGR